MQKTIFLVLLFFILLYGGVWLFNHINAWLGFAFIGGVIYFYAKKYFKPNV